MSDDRRKAAPLISTTYLFNLEDITGNDLRSLDFLQFTIAQDGGFQSQGLFQFFDDGAGLEFLDESDGGIEEQQSTDDAKVDPVLETGGQDSGGL